MSGVGMPRAHLWLIVGVMAALSLTVATASSLRAQSASALLVVHGSTVVLTDPGTGPVLVEVARDGQRAAYASTFNVSNTAVTLTLAAAYPATGPAAVLPGDTVKIVAARLDTTVTVPEVFADVDADVDRIAALLPPDLEAEIVVLARDESEVIHQSFTTTDEQPWTYDASVDVTRDESGYVDIHEAPGVVVRARFAPIRVAVDAADGVIHGYSTPDAWLHVTAVGRNGQVVSRDVGTGVYLNADAITGAAEWEVRLLDVGQRENAIEIAGGQVMIHREDVIVPGAAADVAYDVPVAGKVVGNGYDVVLRGAGRAGSDVAVVSRPLYGEPTTEEISVATDGTWDIPSVLRPGDRIAVTTVVADGFTVTYSFANPSAFVVPHAASVMVVADDAIAAQATLTGAGGVELGQTATDIRDGWGSSALMSGRSSVPVEAGAEVRFAWGGTEASVVVPTSLVTVTGSTGLLEGSLWPEATATVYQWDGDAAQPVGDVSCDVAGTFSVALDPATLEHDGRGVVVARVSDKVSLVLAWAVPEPLVDLLDAAVRLTGPVGSGYELDLTKIADGGRYTEVARIEAPQRTAAAQWLSPTSLPLRTTQIQFERGADGVVPIDVGDVVSLTLGNEQPIEVRVASIRTDITIEGRAEGLVTGAMRVEGVDLVLDGGPGAASVRRPAQLSPDGFFEADVAELRGPDPLRLAVEVFVPSARIRTAASQDTLEVALQDGLAAGRGMPNSAVHIVLRRGGVRLAGLVASCDGVGDYHGRLEGDDGLPRAPEAGDVLQAEFQGVRSPITMTVDVPELTAVISDSSGVVTGRGPKGGLLSISAVYERGRIAFGTLVGAADAGGSATGWAVVGATGEFESELVSQYAEPFRSGPGVRVSVDFSSGPVTFYRDVVSPLIGLEVGGPRVRVFGDPRATYELQLSEGDAAAVVGNARGQTDAEGYAQALWTRDGAPQESSPTGAVSGTVSDTPVAEEAVPLAIQADWTSNTLVAEAPPGFPVYSAAGRCFPWGEAPEGLAPVPGADTGARAIPVFGSPPPPGQWYMAGVFGASGHFLFREAIRPLVILDPAGAVRGCATPRAAVAVTVRDEGGHVWSRGAGRADAFGWYEVALTRNGTDVPIRPTDHVVAEVEGSLVETSGREPFAVAVDGQAALVHGTPGQRAVLVADDAVGRRVRVASSALDDAGSASLPLNVVEGLAVARWIVMVESVSNAGHFVGTVLPGRSTSRAVYLPLLER